MVNLVFGENSVFKIIYNGKVMSVVPDNATLLVALMRYGMVSLEGLNMLSIIPITESEYDSLTERIKETNMDNSIKG